MVDPAMEWAAWCFHVCTWDKVGIMEGCLKMFEGKHPKLADKDVASVTDQELLSDMVQMQQQPAIMDNHRRFVMIIETRNEQAAESRGVSSGSTVVISVRHTYRFSHRSSCSTSRSLIFRTTICVAPRSHGELAVANVFGCYVVWNTLCE